MATAQGDPRPNTFGDIELLERWAQGDNEAGAELFERYFRTLRRFFAERVPHAADDLVQTTLLSCIEGRSRLRDSSSFKAFLLAIARNQLYGFYRKQGTERDKQRFNTTSRFCIGESPSTLISKQDEDAFLRSVLRTLPESMQLILELAYWEDLSPVELAEVLDIPVNAVHSRLFRAKQRLREKLEAFEQASPFG
jgi:RNA polymerase sigma-70 factor (ECF subfamily)